VCLSKPTQKPSLVIERRILPGWTAFHSSRLPRWPSPTTGKNKTGCSCLPLGAPKRTWPCNQEWKDHPSRSVCWSLCGRKKKSREEISWVRTCTHPHTHKLASARVCACACTSVGASVSAYICAHNKPSSSWCAPLLRDSMLERSALSYTNIALSCPSHIKVLTRAIMQ
jgi:hypothetical protein